MKSRLEKFAVAVAFLSLLSAPLRADEGEFLKELEKGRQVLQAETSSQKCHGGCRKITGAAKGSVGKPMRDSLRGASSAAVRVYGLSGKTTVAGSGPVYRYASQPHWFSGTVPVKGIMTVTGRNGVHGTVELSGNIYVSGSGHSAAGPAAGQGWVAGKLEVFAQDGKSLAVLDVLERLTVSGQADGFKADVSGTVVY